MKSPESLSRYIESRKTVDWIAIRNALGLKYSSEWLAPCGGNFPAADAPCSTEIITVSTPDQAIVIIRGGVASYTVEYLRYLRDAKGGWSFSGENSAFQRNSPSHHQIMSAWDKPFLSITSDHSQGGVGIQQILEDWFDLTQPGFEPAFSLTIDGSQYRFGFGVGRTIHATYKVSQAAEAERIELHVNVHFGGVVGLDQESAYFGVFERRANEKVFKLQRAFQQLDRPSPIPAEDFADLADPFSGLTNEKLLAFAFAGLEKIATGADSDAKGWLKSILSHAQDTPEKLRLLDLLMKP